MKLEIFIHFVINFENTLNHLNSIFTKLILLFVEGYRHLFLNI